MKRNDISRGVRTLAATFLTVAAFGAAAPSAQAQSLSTVNVWAVPTYESAGLYWWSPATTTGCKVQFRVAGTSSWTQGLDMWYDVRDNECRGSLVSLTPNTSYEVQMGPVGGSYTNAMTFRTWSNSLPVARTVTVPAGSGTLNITQGGSAAGYVVYEGNGAMLDAGNAQQFNVSVNASYVIVRGLVLKGAMQDAVRIAPNVTDVVIEDNDISAWGRTSGGGKASDMDSGVRAICTQPTLERVTIQRNKIHDPRYPANNWSTGHPAGAQGVTFSFCGGNHVIRHNEIFSGNGNHFNDGIGGEDNFSKSGFPNADSDIYGNVISQTWDDGIEAEGGNENVRIWGNFLDQTGTGVASTVVSVGPMYIFRNVWNRNQFLGNSPLDQDDRQPMMKAGSDSANGHGRRYIFHNTMLQPTGSGASLPLGGGGGVGGAGIGIWNTISKNNIWHTWKANTAFYETQADSSAERDMYNGSQGDMNIVNGINAAPTYASWLQLAAGTPGYDQAARIPNFNDAFAGNAPDVGAAESGLPAMTFGIPASAGSAIGGAGVNTSTAPTGTGTTGTGTVSPPPVATTGSIAMSTSLLGNFTAATTQSVTYTNTSTVKVSFIQASMSSARYTQTNTCGDVAPGASCKATITYSAGNTGSAIGTLTVTSTAPNSPHVLALSADGSAGAPASAAESALITQLYRGILRRDPDSVGYAYWQGEVSRVAGMGGSANEAYYAMAMAFFSSNEYAAFNRDNTGFVTDLYQALCNRAPDAPGVAYWLGLMAQGMPREVLLASFMFSSEFTTYIRNALGTTPARAEVDLAMDLYRGLLARLPDNGGFIYSLQSLRTAQCQGSAAVSAVVEQMSSAMLFGAEYTARSRANSQFVGDLYNAMLRRGGDLPGVQFYLGQLAGSGMSRDQMRRTFIGSPEFQARVRAVVAQGCAA